ncbi:zinc finger, CCHC-type containing protein [Tanacetum coccineum]
MGEGNPIRTLRDYAKSSHDGYRDTIELLVGNYVDFLKLVDSLDLDGANRERIRLRLFQFSLHNQASNWLERLPAGSITTWEDLTTRFIAQFFPPRRTTKLRNDILMFQQHHGESLSKAWTRFKDLLQKVPHHGIDHWLQIQIFYDHVSFHHKCEINRVAGGKIHNKNPNESWEIIENLALYDQEGWNDLKKFVKPVKDISTPQPTLKIPDRRLLVLEGQINFLLKGSRPMTKPSSTHVPQAYTKSVYSNPRPRNQNKPPKLIPFTFCERTAPNPQSQQQEEINDGMTEMSGLLKELTTSKAPEKVLIREDAKSSFTKSINSISLAKREEERNDKDGIAANDGLNETDTEIPVKEAEKENKAEGGTKIEPIKRTENDKVVEVPSSQPIKYYLKHDINEKLIEGLVDNHRFNDSLLGVRVRKVKGKTYNVSPRGAVYEAILKKKITRKEYIGGNFEIPCNIGGLKGINALVDQGSDMNVMPLSTYMKLTDEWSAETNIRLSLASHSYIYPLGIEEDVLVEVVEHVYPVDFMILDIKEDEKRPFILGTPFLTTSKAIIKFNKGTITLRSGKSKISFYRIPESLYKVERGIKNDIEPIAPITIINRLVLEWEERIKLHLEKEMKFDR